MEDLTAEELAVWEALGRRCEGWDGCAGVPSWTCLCPETRRVIWFCDECYYELDVSSCEPCGEIFISDDMIYYPYYDAYLCHACFDKISVSYFAS